MKKWVIFDFDDQGIDFITEVYTSSDVYSKGFS